MGLMPGVGGPEFKEGKGGDFAIDVEPARKSGKYGWGRWEAILCPIQLSRSANKEMLFESRGLLSFLCRHGPAVNYHPQISQGCDLCCKSPETAGLAAYILELHGRLWYDALTWPLKGSDVSCGALGIKEPSERLGFSVTSVCFWPCTPPCLQPPHPHPAPGTSCPLWPAGLTLCDVLHWSIAACREPCFWIPQYTHIDFSHSQQQYQTKGLTLGFHRSRLNYVWPPLCDFHSASDFLLRGAFLWCRLVFRPFVLQSMFYY